MRTVKKRRSLRQLFIFAFIFLQILTCSSARPVGPKGKPEKLPHHQTIKEKTSQEGQLLQNSCVDPGSPVNGHRVAVQLQPRTLSGLEYFPIGAKVRFGCEAEYLLRGFAVLTCERGRPGRRPVWDSSVPQCVALLRSLRQASDPCGDPPMPSLFAFTASYSLGQTVKYQCIEGYTPSEGDEQLSCISGAWLGRPLQCRRELATCTDFGPLTNGLTVLTGTMEGDVVAFRCSQGYSLLGARQLRCKSDSNWGLPWPICIKDSAQCGDPGTSANVIRTVYGTREDSLVEYSCKRGYQLVGPLNRTCLSNGQWSGSTPTCERIQCGIPETILQGTLSFTSTSFGSVATYACNPGFYLSGQATATCGAGGYWTSSPPTCTAVSCPELVPPRDGSISFTDTKNQNQFGDDAIFSCNIGFGMMGAPRRTCQANGTWSGFTPSCKIGSCGSQSDPANGAVTVTHTNYGGYAIFSCDKGYIMEGPNARVCQYNGQWSLTPPTCRPVECPVLSAPSNGAVWPSKSNKFKSMVVYSCNYGYFMFGGSEMRECQATGRWNGTRPACFGIRCPKLTPPHKGMISYSTRIIGTEAVYSCEPGYKFTLGDKVRTCLSNQQWSGIAPCCVKEEIVCPALAAPANGLVVFNNRVGDEATYRCNSGFQLLGVARQQCQADGTWSEVAPSCFIPCSILSDPVNGMVTQNGTQQGSSACYFCEEGFKLADCDSGMNSCTPCRTCGADGKWTGIEPSCTAVPTGDCGTLVSPGNGSVDLSEGTRLGARANYSCALGFELVGLPTRTCGGDGKWTGTAPTCNLVECGSLAPPANGLVVEDGVTVGDIARYFCNEGHFINGTSIRECQATGVWSGREPVCQVRDCGLLQDPVNGVVDFSNGTTFNSVANYSCVGTFILTGANSRTCLANGSWSDEPPMCEEPMCEELTAPANTIITLSDGNRIDSMAIYSCVNNSFRLVSNDTTRRCTLSGWTNSAPLCTEILCPNLDAPSDGEVVFLERSIGSMATYTCNDGFMVVGPDQRTCLPNGTWTDTDPTCTEILCPVLVGPSDGEVVFSERSVGSLAMYTCNDGFTIVGLSQRTCLENGTWSNVDPTCTEVFCPLLGPPTDGQVNSSSRTVDSVATYACDDGFRIMGSDQRTCLQNGTWTGTDPVCMRILCPILNPLTDGQVNSSNRSIGSVAIYSCNDGFLIEGPDLRTCLPNGTWTGIDPTCNVILCPELPSPVDGSVNASDRVVASVASYSCDEGFRLEGADQRVCQLNGTWNSTAPTCTPITCPSLSDPVGGIVLIFDDSPGGLAIYTCDPMLTQIGDPIRTCGANGSWEGTAPECRNTMCPLLQDPENGIVEIGDRMPGSMAIYSCNGGYGINGSNFLTCGNDTMWDSSPPTCIRLTAVTCPDLADPVDGSISGITSRNLNGIATYMCDTGFSLARGDLLRFCLANETWSGSIPVCRPDMDTVSCPLLTSPEGGTISLTRTSVGAMATFECPSRGTVLEGSAERVCQDSGMWSGTQPTCGLVNCGTLEAPANGTVTLLQGSTFFENVAIYSCNMGFTREGGSLTRICEASGQWNGNPPTCRLVDCGPLAPPTNGRVNTSAGTLLGQVAMYSCNTMYRLVGVVTRTCLLTREWSDAAPICEIITCPDLENPINGVVAKSMGNQVDSIATYTCDPGFTGAPTFRVCLSNGTWTGSEPICLPDVQRGMLRSSLPVLECPRPLSPSNGAVLLSVEGDKSTAVFSCDPGHTLKGQRVMTCVAGQLWSHDPPTCHKLSCGDPGEPANGRLLAPGGFDLGSTVYFIPRDGYEVAGATPIAQCMDDGRWSAPTPNYSAADKVIACPSEDGKLDSFGRQCICGDVHKPTNCCRYRREWSSLSAEDKHLYTSTVLLVSSDPKYQPLYKELLHRYQASFKTLAQSTDISVTQFLHWHRHFLMEYEDLLRLVHRNITLPYWDWSSSHTPYSTPVFDPSTGFGNSSDPDTGCVNSGPFRRGEFKIPSNSSTPDDCLIRRFRDFTFPIANVLEEISSNNLEHFVSFHKFVQIFLGLNIRCFIGGEMCSSNAASDPLFALHLAEIDSLIHQWQDRNPDHASFLAHGRSANEPLVHTLDSSLRLANFSRNEDLAYGTCVKYSPNSRETELEPLLPAGSGSGDARETLAFLCLPQSIIKDSGVTLSESVLAFISEICDQT